MRILLLITIALITLDSYGGEIVLKGVYRGKDLYVKNPYNPSDNSFCTEKIFVNDRLTLEAPRASALRIDLSYLNSGALVVIRIEHKDGCVPVVLNPEVLSGDKGFRFLTTAASNNSIDWVTEGEEGVGSFIIEQEIYNADNTFTWKEVARIQGKGDLTSNSYSASPAHFPGENKYRIRYDLPEVESVYSVDILYTSTKTPITFQPVSVTTRISLSESTTWEIADRNGRILKSGFGSTIMLQELRPGEYFLHIQNRVEKFVKK